VPVSDLPARVGLLGGGVIGGGWAARFLINGVDVCLFDPDPAAPRKLEAMLANARHAYARLTLAPVPTPGVLSFAASPEEAAEGADLVQESAPERLELKRSLLAAASRAAAAQTVFCSSTSGLRPTALASTMTHPERFLVGHPFNPVYLLPLVELCGGRETDPDAVARAEATYRAVGMHPLRLRAEIDGFVADRLLEALWREALWLVRDDVATVAEIDDAIRYAAGVRWAVMGTFLTYRIAGGEAGMRHFMAQFGPTLQAPWTKLVDVPELTDELLEKIVAQSDDQAAGRTVGELERERDESLIAVLHALRSRGVGAGATLAGWERGLMRARGDGALAGADGAPPDTSPLRSDVREIPDAWLDYNHHVHESRYLQLCGDATDALLIRVGVDADYLQARGSYYTVETHLSHLGQLRGGDRAQVLTQILDCDAKRLHLFHTVERSDDGRVVATAEQMLVHVDAATQRVAPATAAVHARIAALAAQHAALARPERAGRRISVARP
jgi:carnitine 3-dehydrogenase